MTKTTKAIFNGGVTMSFQIIVTVALPLVGFIGWGMKTDMRLMRHDVNQLAVSMAAVEERTEQIPPEWFLRRVDGLEKRVEDHIKVDTIGIGD